MCYLCSTLICVFAHFDMSTGVNIAGQTASYRPYFCRRCKLGVECSLMQVVSQSFKRLDMIYFIRQEAERFGYAYVDMASDFSQRLVEAEGVLTLNV